MKLCFSTLGCPEWYWEEILAVAKDLGYSGIEVRGIRKEIYVPKAKPFLPSNIDESKRELKRLNLSIPCLTSACDLHIPEERERTLREAKEYIDLAAGLEAPYIRLLGDTYPEPTGDVDVGLVKDMAGRLADYAAKENVTLLIETNGFFSNTEKLARLLDDLNHPHVAALWDIHHPYRFAGESPEVTYGNLAKYIRHVHIKDSRLENRKIRYTTLGGGDLPVEGCVRVLEQGGYDGFYSLEWVKRWDLSLEEPGIVFSHFVNYMTDLEAVRGSSH
ncbi:MAG: sugar phosphate isomerase/epimerase family protein [Clostridia bacterium]|jgi:fatty-acyl-CoA synthase